MVRTVMPLLTYRNEENRTNHVVTVILVKLHFNPVLMLYANPFLVSKVSNDMFITSGLCSAILLYAINLES
jgi:hypothetical protein